MEYQVREFINEKYTKAVNILKDNLKENYHVFYGVRLSEILFPASEYGTDAFFKEFELINSVILPLVIFDLTQRKPMMIISFDKILDASLLEGTNIVVLVVKLRLSLHHLYVVNFCVTLSLYGRRSVFWFFLSVPFLSIYFLVHFGYSGVTLCEPVL
ncbi:DNA distortion polypeptide 3 [Salmonella enterica]|uniref:DNA distortion polypeptide 3 n=1 Tax=Salmonella enterica TaxID=28901 RepID=UPI00398AB595